MASIPQSATFPLDEPSSSNPNLLRTIDCQFVDNTGRTLLLRGVNLSGASKNPPGRISWMQDGFWEDVEEDSKADEGTDKDKSNQKDKLTFIGRPFNLDDGSADVHLARLRGWGFNVLRFPFTWEALEHKGPGIYDYDYMDYTIRVLVKCSDYGFKVIMDPHQDTWSRFSGGDGAPFWTLAACGINPHNLGVTQACILHCEYPTPESPDPGALPAMLWSTNYGRLLSQTLFTLFFAGRSYAPKCIIDNLNIQDWLQSHYINACAVLADRIAKFENGRLFDECIIGWDSLNEPTEGFCGWEDLNANPTGQGSTLKKGTYPTPAQSLRMGMGAKQTVENWSFGKLGPARDGQVTIDPKGLKMWAEPIRPDEVGLRHGELPDGTHTRWGWKRDVDNWPLGTCIWALHGVWDIETGFILRPDYFQFKYEHFIPSEPVEFLIHHWRPHFIEYATRIRQIHPLAILFVQPPVFSPPPPLPESILQGRCVYAPHYYDGMTLVTRHWNWFNADALGLIRGKYGSGVGSSLRAVRFGENAIRKSFQDQMGYFKDDVGLISAYCDHDEDESQDTNAPPCGALNPKYPTLIGEIGTPFDMDSKKSYGYTDNGKYKYDYTSQTKALDASLNGCDGRQGLSWTVWQYVPEDHTWEWGDGWDMEDLSVWSWADWREEDVEEGQFVDSPTLFSKQLSEPISMTVISSSSKLVDSSSSSLSLPSSSSSISASPRVPSSATLLSSPAISQINLKGYSPNPYDFLTNGARAVQAFVRPWPTKVVGKTVDMSFDIRKGVFKLEVEVGKGDRARLRRSAGKNEEEGDDDELATEIYIPLVHYAHSKVLESSWMAGGKSKNSSKKDAQKGTRSRAESNVTLRPTAISSSSSATTLLELNNMTKSKSQSDAKHHQDRCSEIINQSLESTPDLVDIQVKVSDGKWSVCGQNLKWWYDSPTSFGSATVLGSNSGSGLEKDTEVKKYTIEIKRRGGPLRIAPNGIGLVGGRGCCEHIFGDGRCLIM